MKNDVQKHARRPLSKVQAIVSVSVGIGHRLEMVFDPTKRETAFIEWNNAKWQMAKSFDTMDGQRFVPFSPNNNLIRHGVVLFPSMPEEYGVQDELIAEIQSFIHRYVDVTPRFERIAAYYVLLTWVYDCFNELPYLRLKGDYGSGKTRFLLTVGSLCYVPIFASGASTVSPIFHTLDSFRGTLIVDEADFRFSDETAEIVKILNNGNVRGLPVLRSESTGEREYNPRAFSVYGPKIVATRGSYLDRALESRFITEETGQRRLRQDIPLNLPSVYRDEARALRNKLLLFRLRMADRSIQLPKMVDKAIEPRLNQIFAPLLSLVDDPTCHEELRELAISYHRDFIADRGLELEAQVLQVIRHLFASATRPTITLKQITQCFIEHYGREHEQNITSRWVGGILRRRLQLRPHKSDGIYVLPLDESSKLDLLYERYGISSDEIPGDRNSSDDNDVVFEPVVDDVTKKS